MRYTLKTLKLKNFLSTIKKLNLLSATSVQIKEILKRYFQDINIKNVLIVYEGQPFQKEIINFFKNKNKKIIIEGYDHSAPPPLPINLIYDENSPDNLLITGEAQKNFYKDYLNWPEKKLKIIKSLRFNNNEMEFYKNKFLPYELRDKNIVFNAIKFLVSKNINLKNIEIKIHPLQKNSKKHLKLVSEIKKLISKSSDVNQKSVLNSSIFLDKLQQ